MNPAISVSPGVLVQITVNYWSANDGYYTDWNDRTSSSKKKKYSNILDVQARFTANVQATPPKEYKALADAATAAHTAMGSAKMCGLCFAGELKAYTKGCCGSCVHLSDTGCVAKTIACAGWTCRNMTFAYGKTIKLFARLDRKINFTTGFGSYYDRGYSQDMARTWTKKELRRLARLAQAYTALKNRIERQGLQIKWTSELNKQLGYKPKEVVSA